MTLIDEMARALRAIIENDWSDQNGCITFQIGNPGALPANWAQKLVDDAYNALARYAATKADGEPNVPHTNTGHGHVWQRPDGYRARCGGPGMCVVCSRDYAQFFKAPEAKAEGAQAPVAWLVESIGSRHLFFDREDAELFARDPSSKIKPLAPQSLPDSALVRAMKELREKGRPTDGERAVRNHVLDELERRAREIGKEG